MKKLIFPTDFNETHHSVMPNSKQWKPKEETDIFISIVGGVKGLYGDGVTTFEIMINDDVTGYLSKDEINEKLAKLATPVKETEPAPASKEGLEDGGFTKGEWKVAMNGEQVWVNNENTICTLANYLPEYKANARLIAAAPAMYEALKEEIECLEEWNGNGNYTTRIEKIKAILIRINKH